MFDQIKQYYAQYKNPILLIALIGAAAFAYFTFFAESEPESLSRTQVSEQVGSGSELLQLLLEVRSIQLDDSIFSDPAFQELDSTVQELSPQPTGRTNPFAPLGAPDNTADTPEQ